MDIYFSEDESLFEMELFESGSAKRYMVVRVLRRSGVCMASRAEGVSCEALGREEEESLVEGTTDLSCILWFGGNRN